MQFGWVDNYLLPDKKKKCFNKTVKGRPKDTTQLHKGHMFHFAETQTIAGVAFYFIVWRFGLITMTKVTYLMLIIIRHSTSKAQYP